MTLARRDTLRRVLRIAGTLALLAATAYWVDVEAVLSELTAARWAPLLVALAISVPLMLALAWRWSFTARRMGLDMPLPVAVGEYYVSTLLNQVLPGGVLGDVGRALRGGRRQPQAKGAVARSVVLERVSGQAALWLFVVSGLFAWGADEGRRLASVVGAAVLVLGVAAVALTRLPGFADTRAGRAWALVLTEVRRSFVERGAWAVQLGLSLASVLALVGIYAACVQAVGIPARPSQLLFIAPVLLVVTSLPVSVGGWGVREAASAALFEMTGLDPAAGVAVSAAFGAVNLVAAMPGVVVLLRRVPATPKAEEQHHDGAAD